MNNNIEMSYYQVIFSIFKNQLNQNNILIPLLALSIVLDFAFGVYNFLHEERSRTFIPLFCFFILFYALRKIISSQNEMVDKIKNLRDKIGNDIENEEIKRINEYIDKIKLKKW